MTSPPENLPAPERVIAPCRLIFWGIIIVLVYLGGTFDIANDFVGMLLILWGVILLARIPISSWYQWAMKFLVFVAICTTIVAFYTAVLLPLQPAWMPPPSNIIFAELLFSAFFYLVCMILFCHCMREYCTVMNWECPRASWLFSAKMLHRGVLIPFIILAMPAYFFLPSLEFFPKNPPPIRESFKILDNETFQYTARQNDIVIHTAIVPISPDGALRYTRPKLDPSPRDGANIQFGEWFALIPDWSFALMMLFVLALLCALIHCWMSLDRTISAAKGPPERNPAEQEPQV